MKKPLTTYVFDADGAGRTDGRASLAADAAFSLQLKGRTYLPCWTSVDDTDGGRANQIFTDEVAEVCATSSLCARGHWAPLY